jgi:hypothetical protein
MDARGGRKPIWITEFSYYGCDDLPRRPFCPAARAWAEERLLDDERQCAEYTVRYLAVMMSLGVEKVFIHSGASGRLNEPTLECGLFDYGGAPRKLLPALAVYTELLGPSPRAAGLRALGKGGHAAAFESGSRSVLVLWQEGDAPMSITVPAAEGLTAMDMMGAGLANPSGGTLPLATSPIYLLGPAGQAATLLKAIRP